MLGRPAGNSWPMATTGLRGPSEKGSAAAWQGFGPRPLGLAGPAGWLRLRPRRCARWRGGVARPAAGGHLRPRQCKQASAGDVRGEGKFGRVARRGWRGEGRRLPWRPSTAAPWPLVARRGEAHPGLGRRRKRERESKEGEAELRARGIGEWRGGAGDQRRRSCGRGEGRAGGSRLWRGEEETRARVSERAGTSR